MWIVEVMKAIRNQRHAQNGLRHLRTDNIRSFQAEVDFFIRMKPSAQPACTTEPWYGRPVYINGERRMVKI